MTENNPLENAPKSSKFRKFIRISYWVSIHGLAAFALFIMLTALAVKFKWTNTTGLVDVNNRYYANLANEYGKDQHLSGIDTARREALLLQQIGVLAKFHPADARKISAAYYKTNNLQIATRMFNASRLLLRKNKAFQKELKALYHNTMMRRKSLYAWSNYSVWNSFCKTVQKDKNAIDSAARITGVEPRLIVMCLVGEQVRMFNANREKFKQYVYPFSHIILPRNRGYGVTSILESTAHRIEKQLIDSSSVFYPGAYFYKCLNTTDAAPGLVIDSIKAHHSKTIQRLIKGGDHFYAYLYTAFMIRQLQSQWEKAGYDLSLRPEIVATLFNLGFQKSKPGPHPKVGGSSFKVGERNYSFGGLCFEFYYSGEMLDDFPITAQPFTPVAVLEKKNQTHLSRVEAALQGDSTATVNPIELP
jgi:hypothetical protein